MGACAQARLVHSIFIPCVPPYRTHLTAVYEIRLAAFLADNLMNGTGHCGGFYLRDIVEEKYRLRPACQELPGLSREKTQITPRLSETSGAQQRKNTNYAPLVGNFRGSAEKKHELRPACRKLPGLNREKTRITPRLSETSGAQQRKNMDYAPLVGNFRGSAEKKHGLRPACRILPGLSREKTQITPRLSETSGAQQRKNTNYALLVGNFRGSAEKKRKLQGIS